MDERLRKLERRWQVTGSSGDLALLLSTLLRFKPLDEWELAAEQEDSQAAAYIELLRDFVNGELKKSSVYINVYEDFDARTSLLVSQSDITPIRRWLRDYYLSNELVYLGREIYDIALQKKIEDPPARFLIENSTKPCFFMYPGEIMDRARQYGLDLYPDDPEDQTLGVKPALLRRLCPDNLWGSRNHYVSFQLIEAYSDPEESESHIAVQPEIEHEHAPTIIDVPHWINLYERYEEYGGPEEGGWHYNVDDPISSLYVGHLPAVLADGLETPVYDIFRVPHNIIDVRFPYVNQFPAVTIPKHLREGLRFMIQLYLNDGEQNLHHQPNIAVLAPGIRSLTGATELVLKLESHPAVQDPFFKPYYS